MAAELHPPLVRFIPACAGNTSPGCPGAGVAAVHPRVRGEHACFANSNWHRVGSSPRARGTHSHAIDTSLDGRFIPACAGNTSSTAATSSFSSVHPRVRGEHGIIITIGICRNGSSPRARGTHRIPVSVSHRGRFIPACAGNTRMAKRTARKYAVHPRVRGEHFAPVVVTDAPTGSSPRARGTPRKADQATQQQRFIPACAGNTVSSRRRRRARAVHPRVRGEHVFSAFSRFSWVGSSPRARGTPRRTGTCNADRRFIPACAGNTLCAAAWCRRQSVHPRVRGEHLPRVHAARW